MRPKKTETNGSGDLFRARLDQIIDMRHAQALLEEDIELVAQPLAPVA